MTIKRPAVRAAATVSALTLAACGSSSPRTRSTSTSAKAPSPTTANTVAAPLRGKVAVAISNYFYHPATITVANSTKVTFTNYDQTAHTATSTKPGFDTGTINPGHSATVGLNKPGVYTYYCQFHAFMHGTIVVK